jgi:hypothetical protein
MTRARSVLLILLLLAGSLSPPGAHAQGAQAVRSAGEANTGFILEQNYPETANPQTAIPFRLEPILFENGNPVTVTIRILNVISQPVAIPEALEHPRGRGVRIVNLPYTQPGRYIAFWDGRDPAGRQLPTGVYYVQMVVGEQSHTKKIVLDNPRRRRPFIFR